MAGTARPVRKRPVPKPVLDEGDTIELSVTLSENYQTVKAGATTTLRPGERVEDAQERLRELCTLEASNVLKDIG